jgi:cycloartenol synthase
LVLQFEREKGYMNKEKVSKELVEDVISEETVRKTLKRALRCYSNLQAEDGFWPGDYGGPLFLLPSLVLLPFPSFFFI